MVQIKLARIVKSAPDRAPARSGKDASFGFIRKANKKTRAKEQTALPQITHHLREIKSNPQNVYGSVCDPVESAAEQQTIQKYIPPQYTKLLMRRENDNAAGTRFSRNRHISAANTRFPVYSCPRTYYGYQNICLPISIVMIFT